MNEDTMELVIELMADKIKELKADLAYADYSKDRWMSMYDLLKQTVIREHKKKRGRPAKKRGPGRPKKVKK